MKTHRYLMFALAALMLGVLFARSDAYALPRVPRSWLFGPQPVWTDGTTVAFFHPLSEPLDTVGLINVRVSTELSEDSGDCEMRAALRFSNDGVTWDTADNIATAYQNGNGTTWGTGYEDITALGSTVRAWVQFGVQVKNGSAGAIQMCTATLRVEPKERR